MFVEVFRIGVSMSNDFIVATKFQPEEPCLHLETGNYHWGLNLSKTGDEEQS